MACKDLRVHYAFLTELYISLLHGFFLTVSWKILLLLPSNTSSTKSILRCKNQVMRPGLNRFFKFLRFYFANPLISYLLLGFLHNNKQSYLAIQILLEGIIVNILSLVVRLLVFLSFRNLVYRHF